MAKKKIVKRPVKKAPQDEYSSDGSEFINPKYERSKALRERMQRFAVRSNMSREIQALEAKKKFKEQKKKGRFAMPPPKFKRTYVSKALDMRGRRWERWATSDEPTGLRTQLVMNIKIHLKAGRGFVLSTGVSSSRIYSRREYRVMVDEAFSSALWHAKVPYGMIKRVEILSQHFIRWKRERKATR